MAISDSTKVSIMLAAATIGALLATGFQVVAARAEKEDEHVGFARWTYVLSALTLGIAVDSAVFHTALPGLLTVIPAFGTLFVCGAMGSKHHASVGGSAFVAAFLSLVTISHSRNLMKK
jgi:hypothetical protein